MRSDGIRSDGTREVSQTKLLGVLELSQVIIAVRDLEQARARFTDLGFSVVDGGTHPNLGTANWIIPLGAQYLELLGVADPALAASNEFGRAVLDRTAAGDRLARWSLRTDEITAVASARGLEPEARSRVAPSGARLTWRAAGLSDSLRRPCRPFFMQWDDPRQYPGAIPVVHPNGAARVGELLIATDTPDEMREWIGAADAPITIEPGTCDLLGAIVVDAAGTPVTRV